MTDEREPLDIGGHPRRDSDGTEPLPCKRSLIPVFRRPDGSCLTVYDRRWAARLFPYLDDPADSRDACTAVNRIIRRFGWSGLPIRFVRETVRESRKPAVSHGGRIRDYAYRIRLYDVPWDAPTPAGGAWATLDGLNRDGRVMEVNADVIGFVETLTDDPRGDASDDV